MITGIGIPVELDLETVTIGFAFKSSFILPMNASDFWAIVSQPFNPTSHPITVFERSINDHDDDELKGFDNEQNEQFEKHYVEAEIVENGTEKVESDFDSVADSDQTNNLASMRWLVYKGLAEIAEKFGLFLF